MAKKKIDETIDNNGQNLIHCFKTLRYGGVMSETNFQKWLELTTDLAEKTIKNYLGAISKIDSNLAEQNIVQMSLEELDSVESLEQIKKDYFSKIIMQLVCRINF